MSDANGIKAATDIVLEDCERKIVVVSAVGKNNEEKIKLTDVLIKIYLDSHSGKNCEELWENLFKRFNVLRLSLGVDFKTKEIEFLKNNVLLMTFDEFVSFGERLTAELFSLYSGFSFLDAKDVIFKIKEENNFFADIDKVRFVLQKSKGVVIPGFYYSLGGEIKLLKRGGGDVSGAILARAFACDYENFTDVDGIYSAIPDGFVPKMLDTVNYRELSFLNEYGFCVFAKEASDYLVGSGITTRVFNTFTKRGGTVINDYVKVFPFAIGRKSGAVVFMFDDAYKTTIEKFLNENKLLKTAAYTAPNLIEVLYDGDTRRLVKNIYHALININ